MPAHGNENLVKLIDCVVIRHAGNIVTDSALHTIKGQLGMKILRQRLRMGVLVFKEPLKHILCFPLFSFCNRIAVNMLKHIRPQVL